MQRELGTTMFSQSPPVRLKHHLFNDDVVFTASMLRILIMSVKGQDGIPALGYFLFNDCYLLARYSHDSHT